MAVELLSFPRLMEKLPYREELDSEPVASNEPLAELEPASNDWRTGLPELAGSVVTLRELRTSDAASLLAAMTNDEVTRFISPPPGTIDGFERFIAWTHRQRTAGRSASFAIVARGADVAIGLFQVRSLDLDFVTTGEFRTLGSAYQDVRDLLAPVTIRTLATAPEKESDEAGAESAGGDVQSTSGATEAASPGSAASVRTPEPDRRVESLDELVEFFVAAGRRGLSVNRYKGLGEMNPETLWATTMDPSKRTLLQVRAEDHTEADLMFTTLMGDQVEPRRKFIEENALDVKNLDI